MDFPTYQNSGAYPAQAVIDGTDLTAITTGVSLNGVVSGCAVSPRSPATMGVSVAAGTVIINGGLLPVAGGNVSISAASSGDRRDIVWAALVSGSMTVGSTAGTPSASSYWQFVTQGTPPVKPATPAGAVLLAEVYVVGTGYSSPTVAITATEILDKRISITPPTMATYATQIDSTNTGYIYVGEAAVGSATSSAVWRISKVTTGASVVITYAGNAQFNQVWNNRASLVYS